MQLPECSLDSLRQFQERNLDPVLSLYAVTRMLSGSSDTAAATEHVASFLRVVASISTGNMPGARVSLLNPSPPGPPHGYMERVRRLKFEISFNDAQSPIDESFMYFV
jgi:hypothetical protein